MIQIHAQNYTAAGQYFLYVVPRPLTRSETDITAATRGDNSERESSDIVYLTGGVFL
ncbi:uncharacterized protein FOMMEDRAFT_19681 [Fomitiporia mediterranea MF3/22]|uniref:uncharacterized protein n=1 Tax=Fomitiporia mediterranea (strain MF3/22) TaxID=694068 RepID=UPI0004407368|nr:uncharacterized protein FOMMEDRAFT_19681 [Fomitiporia mediterranea MF3/22]EJD04457.1 hypothetical protein FOMMEDRAFT_19681 [Fomitiporia mediterranea MF3/22]